MFVYPCAIFGKPDSSLSGTLTTDYPFFRSPVRSHFVHAALQAFSLALSQALAHKLVLTVDEHNLVEGMRH